MVAFKSFTINNYKDTQKGVLETKTKTMKVRTNDGY